MTSSLEIVMRSLLLLVVLFLFTKWLGKKQVAQLNIFDFISGIVLGGIVAIHTSTIDNSIIHALLALTVWFLIPLLVDFIALKNRMFREFIRGKSTVLINNGKILEDNLNKERYTTDDLLENLRAKNIFKVADVEFATLEPSGILNVLPKSEKRTITPYDLGIEMAPEKAPQTVIMDGKMLLEPLTTLQLNPNWLNTELEKLNVSIENVFIGQVTDDSQLTVDLYDDLIVVPQPTEKPLLLATMKKCQADLELFALATNNIDSKQMYERNALKLAQATEMISPYLNKK